MPTDSGAFGVRVVPDLLFQFGRRSRQGLDCAPFTLAEIDPTVLPQSNDIDLHLRIPIRADLIQSRDILLLVEERQRFPTQRFVTQAKIGFELRLDDLRDRTVRTHLSDETGVR